jgi:glycosyltransferase involved in cell wall biosynthesis
MKEKISIIIPVHNAQEYLTACIDNVLSQETSGFELEIIIIDGGSTDRTGEICLELQKKHEPVIKFVPAENLGVSKARNTGLDMATGKYISFLDADDRLLPGALKSLYQIAEISESDIVGCGFTTWHNEQEYQELLNKAEGFSPENLTKTLTYTGIEYIDRGILTSDTRCWSKLYHSGSIRGVRFDEKITIGEDMLFVLAAIKKVSKITTTSWAGYAYYLNPEGAMLRPFEPSYMDQITCWQIAREQIRKIRPDLEYRAAKNLIISIMLTVGKIAVLPANERKQYQEYIDQCSQYMAETLKVPGAFELLDKAYRSKVKTFKMSPAMYMKLYNTWKN